MASSFFPYIGAFLWVSLFLAIGTLLRAKIKAFQKLLVPASLLGGLVGFVFMNLGLIGIPTPEGWVDIPTGTFGVMTFHLFAFSFVGVGLMKGSKGTTSKTLLRGGLWMALMYSFCWSLQGLIGKGVFELWHTVSSVDFNTCQGFLIGTGFAQGPGQAQSYAAAWETNYGVMNSVSVGLAAAAMGFVVAIVLGVPTAYVGIKKGWIAEPIKGSLPQYFLRGTMDADNQPACAFSTTHPSTIDNFTFHIAIMGILYACAYAFGLFWTVSMPKLITALGFGLLYSWGMVFAMTFRVIMTKINCFHMIDQDSVRHIINSAIDYMICSVFLAINVSELSNVVVPFFVTIVLAALATFAVIMWFARRFENFNFERGMAIFGCYTGTVATGMLLLRIVDPDFKSPAAVELGVMNLIILATAAPLTYGYPLIPGISGYMTMFMIGYVVLTPFIMYALKMIRKPSW